jgi:hypothetical protein
MSVKNKKGRYPMKEKKKNNRTILFFTKTSLLCLFTVSLAVAFGACGTPTPSEIRFSEIRQKVFSEHGCTFSSCHGAGAAAYLNLEQSPYNALVGVKSSIDPDKTLVIAGNPEESLLYQLLQGSVGAIRQMPVGSQLPQDKLDLVRDWIAQGAKNDP